MIELLKLSSHYPILNVLLALSIFVILFFETVSQTSLKKIKNLGFTYETVLFEPVDLCVHLK